MGACDPMGVRMGVDPDNEIDEIPLGSAVLVVIMITRLMNAKKMGVREPGKK